MKRCSRCNLLLHLSRFSPRKPMGISSRCKSCACELMKDYRIKNYSRLHEVRMSPRVRKHDKAVAIVWRQSNMTQRHISSRLKRQLLKQEALEAYGRTCKCCGEYRIDFLTIDHINRDGKKHRESIGFGMVYSDLKKRGWPNDGFRILCINCNWAIRFGDPCPHEAERIANAILVS